MDNIEKFEKIKELNRLKSEYHKRELLDLITLKKSKSKEVPYLAFLTQTSSTFYHIIKSFLK